MKKVASHIICVMATLVISATYFTMAIPDWQNERLRVDEIEVQSKIEKPVYVTHRMKEVAFHLHQGDKCLNIANQSFSFGVPDADDMGYKIMMVICPGKGAGWVENSW